MTELRSLQNSQNEMDQWEQFVNAHPDGTLYHTLAWRDLIQQEYGFQPQYFTIGDREGNLCGIAPFFKIRNLTGTKLHSLPFSMYGGLLVKHPSMMSDLIPDIKRLALSSGNARIVMECREPIADVDLHCHESVTDSFIDFASFQFDFPTYLENLDYKVKYEIRKAEKHGFKMSVTSDSAAIHDFYQLLFAGRKKLRLPTPRQRYLATLMERFAGKLVMAYDGGRAVAGAMLLNYGACAYNVYNATAEEARKTNPGYLIYLEMMRWACEQRRTLYLGGSPHPALLAFKKKWLVTTRQFYSLETLGKAKRAQQSSGIAYWDKLPDWVLRPLSFLAFRYLY